MSILQDLFLDMVKDEADISHRSKIRTTATNLLQHPWACRRRFRVTRIRI